MKKFNQQKGFTLIELLIGMAIISILSATVAVSSQNFRLSAQASQIAAELREIERSFESTASFYNFDYTYPTETYLGLGANPTLESLITNNFLDFIGSDIAPTGLGNGVYNYDNDGDSYLYLDSCPGVAGTQGVNVFVASVSTEADNFIINELDNVFDSGDGLTCGKIRVDSGVLLFSVSIN